MDIQKILKIVYAASAFLTAAIPLAITLYVTIKKKIKLAKDLAYTIDEAEKVKLKAADSEARTEMLQVCNSLIANAEALYADVANLLKREGKSAGIVKKDSVMSKLQAYALERGYTFDAEYWDKKVDEIVELTRKVNASK